MDADVFDYHLPPHLIAQQPCADRDQARLMVVHRKHGTLDHRIFSDLPDLLDPGDLLVLNDTRVVPARLHGYRERTGGKWEGLFLKQRVEGPWELLCRAGGRLAECETIVVEPGHFQLKLLARTASGHWLASPVDENAAARPAHEILEQYGNVPLPPYIRKGRANPDDRDRYQTVFARCAGAIAAPTAGLHFSSRTFEALQQRNIGWTYITLHVGLGTFHPLQEPDVHNHKMHQEWGQLSLATAASILACKARGSRVVAVGTTSVRVLETVAATGSIQPWQGDTNLFIYSPYRFLAVDSLITNFHLPRTTLLLLVSAFGGIELMKNAYKAAIEQAYRFYSYGDAMLIL